MRILIVEDEEKVSRFIVRGLTAESFAVDAAADGRAGLELASSYNYDLIVLDLMLPELSGTEVLRQIRSTDHRVPILMLTVKSICTAHKGRVSVERTEGKGTRFTVELPLANGQAKESQ